MRHTNATTIGIYSNIFLLLCSNYYFFTKAKALDLHLKLFSKCLELIGINFLVVQSSAYTLYRVMHLQYSLYAHVQMLPL